MLESFHFLRPWWLLGVVPLSMLALALLRRDGGGNPWSRVVDARLLPLLMAGRNAAPARGAVALASVAWIVAVLALADPTWERLPQPVYQTAAARVVVLDLARSMNAADLPPSRLARARYAIEDVLAMDTEGQTGLVVYAGDAFTVSPLTRDANTIRSLLKVLDPDLMPVDGNRADLGLLRAGALLHQAGMTHGDVLLIADTVDPGDDKAGERAAAQLAREGYRVSVIGAGATGNGERPASGDASGALASSAPAAPPLDSAALRAIAQAGGGEYRAINDPGLSLKTLLGADHGPRTAATLQGDATTRRWKEMGPWLAILLLPLAALAFRRNWLLGAAVLVVATLPPQPAMASTWSDLWQRPDQQAAKALRAGDYPKAAALAPDAALRGSAEYKRGNYQQALDDFAHVTGSAADYNRGNALARLGRYQDAIAAYDQSLKANPGDADALANKAAVAALLQQQQKQKEQQQQHQDAGTGPGKEGNPQGSADQGKGADQQGAGQKSGDGSPQPGASGTPDSATAGKAAAGNDHAGPSGKGSAGQPDTAAHAAYQGSGQQAGDAASAQPPGTADTADQARGQGAAGAAQQPHPGASFAEAASRLAASQDNARAKAHAAGVGADGGAAGNPAAPRTDGGPARQPAAAGDTAKPLDSEEQMAAEQWLRRIPDDPGGLLRRKFLYQYRQRAQHNESADN
jgi:Ca-activated chloride channel family protein